MLCFVPKEVNLKIHLFALVTVLLLYIHKYMQAKETKAVLNSWFFMVFKIRIFLYPFIEIN